MINQDNKKKIIAAVKQFESNTCGELVPVIVETSDNYLEVHFYCAAIMTFLLNLTVMGLSYSWTLPYEISVFDYSVIGLMSAVFGYVIPFLIPQVKRLITPNSVLVARVESCAAKSFIDEEIFNTNDRIGILIFISILEKRVVLLADSGINRKVEPKDWEMIVNPLSKDIKSKALVDGLIRAIQKCGKLLLAHGFKNIIKTENELKDHLRTPK